MLKIPGIYKYIIKYVTPVFLLAVLVAWFFQDWLPIMRMENVPPENIPYILATRVGLVVLFLILAILVKIAWRKRKIKEKLV